MSNTLGYIMQYDGHPHPWTIEEVQALEQRLHLRLPADYRRHLLETGSGPLPRRIVPGTGDNAILHTLLAYPDFLTLLDSDSSFYELQPDHYLPVAGGEGGAMCIGLTEPITGQLFWADYDHAERLGLTEQLDNTEIPYRSEDFIVHRYNSWCEFTADLDTWELV